MEESRWRVPVCLEDKREWEGRADSKICHEEIQGWWRSHLPMWGELLLPRGRGRNFPGNPEIKTPGFHCKGPEPWSGKFSMPSRCGKKKKKKVSQRQRQGLAKMALPLRSQALNGAAKPRVGWKAQMLG